VIAASGFDLPGLVADCPVATIDMGAAKKIGTGVARLQLI